MIGVAVADGWHHVFERGIERRDIYRDDRDREHWLELMEEEIKGEAWAQFANRRGDWGCALFLWGAQRSCALTLRELGQAAGGMKAEAVSIILGRFVLAAQTDEVLRELQPRVAKMSSVHP